MANIDIKEKMFDLLNNTKGLYSYIAIEKLVSVMMTDYVKSQNKLVTENIKADITYLSVIAEKPIPVVKLSILTESPNSKYPGILKRNFSSFSLKLDIIISIAINDKIMPTKMLVFIIILFVTNKPMLNPISGIIK